MLEGDDVTLGCRDGFLHVLPYMFRVRSQAGHPHPAYNAN